MTTQSIQKEEGEREKKKRKKEEGKVKTSGLTNI